MSRPINTQSNPVDLFQGGLVISCTLEARQPETGSWEGRTSHPVGRHVLQIVSDLFVSEKAKVSGVEKRGSTGWELKAKKGGANFRVTIGAYPQRLQDERRYLITIEPGDSVWPFGQNDDFSYKKIARAVMGKIRNHGQFYGFRLESKSDQVSASGDGGFAS